jgi:branched-chain amino acid transport system ATP-binding protein
MLEIANLHARYGSVKALMGVTLAVPNGSLVGVLGANGSGKTTLMQAIAGLIKVTEGQVTLHGEPIHTLPAHQIAQRGLMLVPQGRMLFAEMTVHENLEMGAFLLKDQDAFEMRLSAVHEMFPILKQRSQQSVALMSGGEQQMLAIARAWMAQPKIMLLDEPSIGLAPKIFDQILETLKGMNQRHGTTLLIAEQNARKLLRLVTHAHVLDSGSIAIQGAAEELMHNEAVRRAYLGF